jgi:hypothetical protein
MRNSKKTQGITVNAIAGTHVVALGLDLSEAKRKGCLGFAIQREDRTEDERYWMSGMKTFAATDPGLGPGGQVSSREHPFQSFQWADYSAKPEHDYVYTVIPLYGSPAALKEGPRVSVEIATEPNHATKRSPHTLFFNRGSVASQEYARRFQDKKPDKLEGEQQDAAYKWLSRGLLEALLEFIARADGKQFGLYGAIYEFQWPAVLKAIKEASATGAEVSVLYDAIPGEGPKAKNEAAIKAVGIGKLTKQRVEGKIMHNKFLVLTKDGKPCAVWTGSTNITENGIFGHFNCGHAVESATLAKSYLDYWEELCGNNPKPVEQRWLAEHNPNPPDPPDPWKDDLVEVFSPHPDQRVLDWYAGTVAAGAKQALFMTFAFSVDERFKKVYERNDDVLRFALLDKAGSGRRKAIEEKEIERIRKRPNVVVAVGNRIVTNSFDRWLAESSGLGTNVNWVHTKFMLVDPLSERPVVVTGSANFSEASTNLNNENMLVIRGDTRVADIYLGEYMRLYSHYAFREAIARKWGGDTFNPSHLDPTDGWQSDYFKAGSERDSRRRYFGAPVAPTAKGG